MRQYLSLLLVVSAIMVNAQDKEYIYYLNDDLQSVPKGVAVVIAKGSKHSFRFLMKYYTMNSGHPFLVESYTDSTLRVLNGNSSRFYDDGRAAEQSSYLSNKLHGSLLRWDSLGRVTDSAMYYENMPLYVVKYTYKNGIKNKMYEFDDTYAKNLPDAKSVIINSDGAVVPEILWNNLVYSGKYAFKQDKIMSNKYLIFKLSDEVYNGMVANDAKPEESNFFKTGRSFSINEDDINGNKLSSKELKGSVLVINYWFINCKPCRMEIPELNALTEEYKNSKNVKFIAIALDSKASIKRFLKLSPFNYQIISDGSFAANRYGVNRFPTHVIVDANGKVYFHTVGSPRQLFYWMRKSINELLEEQSKMLQPQLGQ